MASTAIRLHRWLRPSKVGRPAFALPVLCLLSAGCIGLPWSNPDKLNSPKGPLESLVLGDGGLKPDAKGDDALVNELEGAKRLFQEKEYAKAQPIFARIAKNKKASVPVLDDAYYYEGACQFHQGDYRNAEGTLKKYLKEFRTGAHAEEAGRSLFVIANYWLDSTREQMKLAEEQRDGKRQFAWEWPSMLTFSFSKDQPINDREGHALQCLEEIRFNDIGGPLGEKALFYIATVKFYRQDYKDADYYYSQLYENFPNSPLAPKAIKQAIICKQLVTGGTCYDCRTVEESRKLIDIATKAYPDLLKKDGDWIQRQLVSVNLQQADRDYQIAEFYRRTGHPGSAYFYYELVRRRYPNTEYAEKSTALMNSVRDAVVREQGLAAVTGQAVAAQPQPPRQGPFHAFQKLFGPAPKNENPIQQVSAPAP